MTRMAVYDLLVDGELYYVGASVNPKARLSGHKGTGGVMKCAVLGRVKWYMTRSKAFAEERKRIEKLSPPGNLRFTPREDRRRWKYDPDEARKCMEAFNAWAATPEGQAEIEAQLAKINAKR